MPTRVAISKKARFEILKRDKFMCRYCGAKAPEVLLHIEHIQPVAKGGTNDLENLIAACESCNQGKGARLLTDSAAIEKSRDLLAKSQAEIDQLEEMIRWRKTISNKKAKQKEFVVSSLEDISDTAFTDYGRTNVLNAFNKHGFDLCADYIGEYLKDCELREERELKQRTFSFYITAMESRNTYEGKIKYLVGIVWNRTDPSITHTFKSDLDKVELTLGDSEELIQSLQKYKSHYPKLNEIQFIDWWHDRILVITETDKCCNYHETNGFNNG